MGLRELIREMLEKRGELPTPSGSRVPDKVDRPAINGDATQRGTLPEPTFAALELDDPESEVSSLPVPPQPNQVQPPQQDAVGGSGECAAVLSDVPRVELHTDLAEGISPAPAPTQINMSGRWSALQNEEASPGSFLWQARQNVNHTRDAGVHVPLQSYWITYDHLDHGQADWYYFWRTRLRAGEALPTDLSYLFLHVYEVLNGIGFETAGEAFAHLHNLWLTYREEHPTLDRYLAPWLTDFVHYHRLKDAAAQSWLTESGHYSDGDLGLTNWAQDGDRRSMPAAVFDHLVGTALKQNKFYQDHLNQAELDDLFRRALLLTDDFYTVETGQSVYLHLAPQQTQHIMRRTFENAAFEHPTFWYPAGTLRPYSEDGRLFDLFTWVVRFTENGARAQAGSISVLQDAELHAPLMAYLNPHLFPENQPEAAPRPSPKRQREEQAMRLYLEDQQKRKEARLQASSPAPQNTQPPPPPAEQQRRTVAPEVSRLAALRQESEARPEETLDEVKAEAARILLLETSSITVSAPVAVPVTVPVPVLPTPHPPLPET
ncbi:TerB N-terminal domain-containing protein, partial [Deinococcus marmoris]|uniref:TerB N-terminal domain-containing protein n=1 Tax=Deinococcus marmoris TaxID=249408 RepID=UPI0039F10646